MSRAALDKRLDALQARIKPRRELVLPEWLRWTTCSELAELEAIYRAAAEADADALSERDYHRAMAIYSAAMARMLDAPSEVRDDPAVVDAYVRAIEDRGRPKWGPQ